MDSVKRLQERAEAAAADQSNLKREQAHNRSRAAAFAEVLEYLKDYFAARPEEEQASTPTAKQVRMMFEAKDRAAELLVEPLKDTLHPEGL